MTGSTATTGIIGIPGATGADGNIGVAGSDPKILQQQLWLLIDNLYQSGLNTPHIKISTKSSHKNDGKNYGVVYIGRDGFDLNFTTSDTYGVWGIDKIITVEEIVRLIKEEIRQSKLDHLLK